MGCKTSLIAAAAALAGAGAASPAAADDLNPIAPPAVCPGQIQSDAPARAQVEAMRCMTDFARRQAGLEEFADAGELERSALRKAHDVLRCDDFSHFACGRDFTHWMRATGYISVPCWRVGENLAWGSGRHGAVRSIFRAWMRSSGHRINILGDFEQIGLGLRVGVLGPQGRTRVWAQHFGTQCEPAGAG